MLQAIDFISTSNFIDLLNLTAFLILIVYLAVLSGLTMRAKINIYFLLWFARKDMSILGITLFLAVIGAYLSFENNLLVTTFQILVVFMWILSILLRLFLFAGWFKANDNPEFITVQEADKYLTDYLALDGVIGVMFDDEARAYPLEPLKMIHIVNDTYKESKFAVTHCILCNTSFIYDRMVNNQERHFSVNVLTIHSNLVLVDRKNNMWLQLTGEGIWGNAKNTVLKQIPFVYMSWNKWKKMYPDSKVLNYRHTGRRLFGYKTIWKFITKHTRDSTKKPLFPITKTDERLIDKDLVIGIIHNKDTLSIPWKQDDDSNFQLTYNLGNENIYIFKDNTMDIAGAFIIPEKEILSYSLQNDTIEINSETHKWKLDGSAITDTQPLTPVKVSFPMFWYAWFGHYRDTKLIDQKGIEISG